MGDPVMITAREGCRESDTACARIQRINLRGGVPIRVGGPGGAVVEPDLVTRRAQDGAEGVSWCRADPCSLRAQGGGGCR